MKVPEVQPLEQSLINLFFRTFKALIQAQINKKAWKNEKNYQSIIIFLIRAARPINIIKYNILMEQ